MTDDNDYLTTFYLNIDESFFDHQSIRSQNTEIYLSRCLDGALQAINSTDIMLSKQVMVIYAQ